jgi:hypothetical protein
MIRKLTEEHKKKISEAIKLQHQTRDNYAMNGKKHKEETKIKMSIASKGKPKTEEHIFNWQRRMSELRLDGKFNQLNKGMTNRKGKYQSNNKITHVVYVCQIGNFHRVPSGMIIHHLDLDSTNNEPSNLFMLTWSTHSKFHAEICKRMKLIKEQNMLEVDN